jgi:riboflavin biosynthesis pyrimidine reductase
VRQIFPVPSSDQAAHMGTEELIAELASIYAYPEGTWVRANMVASVDGAISVDGRSGGLSGRADRLIFKVLRSLADVILVGAGTAKAEHYGRVKPASIWPQLRQGRPATPPIAVVTGRLSLDLDSQLISGDGAQTILLTTSQAPAERIAAAAATAKVIVAGDSAVSATAAIAKLTSLGFHRILVEGGPTLLGQLAADRLLDELCVTTSPVLEGGHSAARMLAAPRTAGDQGTPTALTLTSMLEDDGFVLSRYCRTTG